MPGPDPQTLLWNDAVGRLVKLDSNGVRTYFLWAGDHLLAEIRQDGTVKAEYSYYPGPDNPHAVIVDGVKYYAHRDGLGNVIALTDELQALQRTYDFSVWGTETGGQDQAGLAGRDRARFKGALRFDLGLAGSEGGIYYMRNRWYEPKTGRFLSEDPIGLEGGINLYAFAGIDPVNAADPTGLKCDAVGSGKDRRIDCLGDRVNGFSRGFGQDRGWGLGALGWGLGSDGDVWVGAQACRALASPLLGEWEVSSPYGAIRPPGMGTSPHRGIDYSVPVGTPVYAMRVGAVYQAGYEASAGWRVGIDHGGFNSRYLHLSQVLVKRGQRVTSLTTIGLSGNSGASTGPHLHVEVFRSFDEPLDPGGCY